MTTRTVLAVDPGTVKCGIAIVVAVQAAPEMPPKTRALHREVVETERLVARVLQITAQFPQVGEILVGNATNGKTLFRALRAAFPETLPLHLAEEAFSSQRARARFHLENPPRGWQRLVPVGMRTPPRPYDDYVAQIIAEDYLKNLPTPHP